MTVVTATPKTARSHIVTAEVENDYGYRYWTKPMPKPQLDLFLFTELKREGVGLSDYCCANTCWCVQEACTALLSTLK